MTQKQMRLILLVIVLVIATLAWCSVRGEAQVHTLEPDPLLWLARAVEGEVGVMGEHREEAGSWVVHVALNRVDSPWFPNNITDVVKEGFFAAHTISQPPQEWAEEITITAIIQHRLGEDPTNGSLFLFGGQDLKPCMDMSSFRGSLKRAGWVFSVHLFGRWPFNDACLPY